MPRIHSSMQRRTGSLVIALKQQALERFFPGGFPEVPEKRNMPVFFEVTNNPAPGQWAARLRELNASVLVSSWSTPSLRAFAETPESCPLNYVCHLTGSVRRLIPEALIRHGLLVSNWGPLVSPQVAEHALLLILAALRDITAWPAGLRADTWKQGISTRTLRDKRVGIFGFGAIARELVTLLRPFGVSLRAWSAGVPGHFIREHGVEPAVSQENLFSDADVLVSCEALTPSTHGAITAALLARLPDNALFVNIARGALVDQAALEAESLSGRIRVALDVYGAEPLPPDNPLRRAPGAVLSPHIAGPTDDADPLIGQFAIQNLKRYFSGLTPEAVVSPEAYARST